MRCSLLQGRHAAKGDLATQSLLGTVWFNPTIGERYVEQGEAPPR